MAAYGGRVLALRSVEFARNHQVPIHVRSSFTWEPGTVVSEEDRSVEQPIVSAVTSDTTEAKITITGVPDQPGIAASLFRGPGRPCDQRRRDRAEHLAPRHDRHLLHRPARRSDGSLEVAELLIPQLGAVSVIADDDVATVSRDRGGHEDPSRRHSDDVRDPRRPGHQHRDDLDLPDPHLVPGPRRARREGGAGPPRRLRALTGRSGLRPVAGAGRPATKLGDASRGLRRHGTSRRRDEVGPRWSGISRSTSVRFFASARSAGRTLPWGDGRSSSKTSSAPISPASTSRLFSCGAKTSLELAPSCRRGRRRRHRQLLRVADGPGGPPRRPRGQPPRLSSPYRRESSPTRTARRWSPCPC